MSYESKKYNNGDILYESDLNNLIAGIDELKAIDLFEESSFNMLNPSAVTTNVRYSTGSAKIIADTSLLIGISELIPVEEGEWYTISGNGFYGMTSGIGQGGYFTEGDTIQANQVAVETITFTTPVSGSGLCFQVPLEKNIKYVALNLKLTDDKSAVSGNAQLEKGEMATDYVPYELKKYIKPELLPSTSASVENDIDSNEMLKVFTTFNNLHYFGIDKHFPKFKEHWLKKDKNLCVVNTGTSLTARSSEHCTLHPNEKFRPPLMHSNNFASHIWDALCWEGQQYRRFDYPDFFLESGTFTTASNLEDWDDGAYRYGITRYQEDGGSVTFTIPADAWQFNFIYRSDIAGAESCVICVSGGDGLMTVLDEDSGEWVEANNYVFSQKESDVTYIDSITYTNPASLVDTTITNYQVKGNTTYQKRLYMKSVTRGAEKMMTITNTLSTGRFSYWGVEWSPREYMITYINAARGSHSSAISTATTALNHYQDNEIWNFKPDLFLTEDPIHNAGGAGIPSTAYNTKSYATITNNFFFADNHISMKSRCQDLGLEEPEWIIFNSTLTYNFKGFDQETGELLFAQLKDGPVWSGLDSQSSCYEYINKTYPNSNIIYINAVKEWCKAAKATYGNLAAATIGSGKAGLTFTNEGSHWNDTGGKIMARIILPVLDFTTI